MTLAITPSVAIVPLPPSPGLYVTVGPEPLVPWALETITKTIAWPARILWVDAANAFNAYIVAIAARGAGKDPVTVLKSYQVARPFTAYQLETMISEKSLMAARRVGASLSVIADPLRLFADAEGRDTQIRPCYGRFIAGLRKMAGETAVLVLQATERSPYKTALLKTATRITGLQFVDSRPRLIIRPTIPLTSSRQEKVRRPGVPLPGAQPAKG